MEKAQFWGRGSRVKTVKAIDEAFRQVVWSDGVKDQRNLLQYCAPTTYTIINLQIRHPHKVTNIISTTYTSVKFQIRRLT